MKRKNTGITLVALIITVVVMLLIAGVTMALALGENGLIKTAMKASEEYEKAAKEELELMNRLADLNALIETSGEVNKVKTLSEANEYLEILGLNGGISFLATNGDIGIVKMLAPGQSDKVFPGDIVKYIIAISNPELIPANNIVITDSLDPSWEYNIDSLLETDIVEVERNFEYSGDYEEFVAPFNGTYKLEVWGAQGGYRNNIEYGGKGGYSSGEVYLTAGTKLYIYVGGAGNTGGTAGGFNGGGVKNTYAGGGGATDIRLVEGAWNDAAGLLSRLIVAGRRRL